MRTRLSALLVLPLTIAACSEDPQIPVPSAPTWGTPISGGNLLITRDGKRAVVADPDRDRILTVQLSDGTIISETELTANDEPGRLVEDALGHIHVALRRGGAVVEVNPDTGAIVSRRAVCAEPRGLAYDAPHDTIHVACTTGDLVTLPAAGGDATRHLHLDRDLRDVIVSGDQLIVTRFRSAEILRLDAAGAVMERLIPPTVRRFDSSGGGFTGDPNSDGKVPAIPAIAWRTIAMPDGRLVMTHQRQVQGALSTTKDGYGGGCGQGPVEDAITIVTPGQAPEAVMPLITGALPVDLAVSPSGDQITVITAGNAQVQTIQTSLFSEHDHDDCGFGGSGGDQGMTDDLGAPTSVAYTSANELVVYYPEVPALVVRNGAKRIISLPGAVGYDAGRGVFHAQTPSGLACASCHPEGRDDGLVWNFEQLGKRRTQNLSGGILRRAPYHWTGDKKDLTALMDDVFAERMGGGMPTDSQKRSLGPWLDRLPAPASAVALDATQVARGKALFESNTVQCAKCHADALFTTNMNQDVGTGGMFKVPSLLGVSARAPFMHDGCAATLRDRFGACGGGDKHGLTSQLDASQLGDLVAYLESL